MADESPTVACPFCAEQILAQALKCRHCGEFVKNAAPKPRPKKVYRPPDSEATSILVFGILGICLCQILGVFAWTKGNAYMDACRSLGVEPRGTAVAGRILGMIASAFIAVALLGGILSLLLGRH